MNGTPAIDHIGFTVSDYAAARAFYKAVLKPLGWTVMMEFPSKKNRPGRRLRRRRQALFLDRRRQEEDDAAPPRRLRRREPQGGRRLLQGGDQGRRQGQRSAGRPPALPRDLLWRLRHRAGRPQHRSRLPQAGVTVAMDRTEPPLTGGCQCGAVRFRVERLGRGSICHCRMCQKAFGAFYGPLITGFGVDWTRGAPKRFRVPTRSRRGFCAECGTPLDLRV